MTQAARAYPDLHDHLATLKKKGLLVTVDEQIDKDSELHPLVRWQFVGGLAEAERKAFLFTNIVDGRGRKYDMPVVVGAIAANRAIYSVGMGVPVEEIEAKWEHAIANPVAPRLVNEARLPRGRRSRARRCRAKATGSTCCRSRSRRRASTARRP